MPTFPFGSPSGKAVLADAVEDLLNAEDLTLLLGCGQLSNVFVGMDLSLFIVVSDGNIDELTVAG